MFEVLFFSLALQAHLRHSNATVNSTNTDKKEEYI